MQNGCPSMTVENCEIADKARSYILLDAGAREAFRRVDKVGRREFGPPEDALELAEDLQKAATL